MSDTTNPVHWYDISTRKVSCGVPGQIGSTKHVRDVTCTECLDKVNKRHRPPEPVEEASAGTLH